MAATGTQELKIGPFAGGINRYSDMSAIGDDEMFDCVNYDIDLDGSLKSRPPWGTEIGHIQGTSVVGATPPPNVQLILYSGTFEAVRFLIFQSNHETSGSTSVDASYIYYFDGVNAGTWTKIADGTYSKAVRYNNDIYIVPFVATSLGNGQKYDLASGIVTGIPNMPSGYSAIVYKDRLWISGRRGIPNNSRLFFSAAGDFTSWPGTNFFDINVGDGDAVQDMAIYQDNMVLFKDSATYVLSYDTNVAGAVLQQINSDVGVNGPRCVVNYENSVFVLQYNRVYEMVNYDFTRVSVKMPFEYDDTLPSDVGGQAWAHPIWMSLVGDRLVCRFFNRLYVYHLRLRAWTRWESEDVNIEYIGPIALVDNTNVAARLGFNTYVAFSSLLKTRDDLGSGVSGNYKNYLKMYRLEDLYDADNVESGETILTPVDIECRLLTKAFDMGVSHRFKRLLHWGVDTISGQPVTGTLFPFSVAYQVTWNQLHAYKWSQMNSWAYPLFAIPTTSQSLPVGSGTARRYLRFPKSIRFRLLQFQVEQSTTGNTSDGPARIYSVTAFVSGKQLVPAAVN